MQLKPSNLQWKTHGDVVSVYNTIMIKIVNKKYIYSDLDTTTTTTEEDVRIGPELLLHSGYFVVFMLLTKELER